MKWVPPDQELGPALGTGAVSTGRQPPALPDGRAHRKAAGQTPPVRRS